MATTTKKKPRAKTTRAKKRRVEVGSTTELGERIMAGLREAIAYERGEHTGARIREPVSARHVTADPAPTYSGPEIAELRGELQLSQAVFASVLNVSAETVRAWEQGKRAPDGAALRLLQVAERDPGIVLQAAGIRTR